MTRQLALQEVDDLAVGAWIIGTGGGGSPHLNHLTVRRIAEAGNEFDLIQPDELDDDAAVAVVSTMGAPVVMQERLQDSRDVARAVEVMATHLGRDFDAVMVGAGTVSADDPRLTVRLAPAGREHTSRVVLLPDAVLPEKSALFEDLPDAPLHVFCRQDADEGAMERLENAGAHVHPVPGDRAALDLAARLRGRDLPARRVPPHQGARGGRTHPT